MSSESDDPEEVIQVTMTNIKPCVRDGTGSLRVTEVGEV